MKTSCPDIVCLFRNTSVLCSSGVCFVDVNEKNLRCIRCIWHVDVSVAELLCSLSAIDSKDLPLTTSKGEWHGDEWWWPSGVQKNDILSVLQPNKRKKINDYPVVLITVFDFRVFVVAHK
ncbi:hypothetical protein MEW_06087 [Candida albicans P60002]|uniref:Uncharacterized protein n=1 Tax=Candida albicans P78048 TaxID=1094989 RepID=A0AB34PIN9_CANAX|nr:hypothetical protein MEU_06135 [Candida albicans P37005]KGR01169.1 hypothetical protein MG3_06168 [Candida albicans P78048]KGU01786.1 hypothetical protein MEY_06140 [Candida albicans 19F]KHC43825.1 hypothetical protein MEW_06087 [Candida albicans P60002]KHC70652.1 hypothetical protein W5Q_06249 [Candida albicans SC5314]